GHVGGGGANNGGSASIAGSAGRATSGGTGSGGAIGAPGVAGAGVAGADGAAELGGFAVKRTDLDSDQPGAAQQDAHLLNARGIALIGSGATQMLAASNFHGGSVDLYDANYQAVTPAGAFTDPAIPAGFAPFNVMPIGDKVYVTYAKQDADQEDDEPGPGNGY